MRTLKKIIFIALAAMLVPFIGTAQGEKTKRTMFMKTK